MLEGKILVLVRSCTLFVLRHTRVTEIIVQIREFSESMDDLADLQ